MQVLEVCHLVYETTEALHCVCVVSRSIQVVLPLLNQAALTLSYCMKRIFHSLAAQELENEAGAHPRRRRLLGNEHVVAAKGLSLMEQEGLNHVYGFCLGADSFRLLEIETQSPESTSEILIRAQLSTHPLAHPPIYYALSYTWNDAEPPDMAGQSQGHAEYFILLDGQRIQIKPNLHHALLEFCSRRRSTYWWIDALCINQNDVTERTHQVSIMQKIYRNAEKVLVWLGSDEEGESPLVREFLRSLLQRYMDDEVSKYEPDWLHQDDEHALLTAGLPPLEHSIWTAVVRFWERRWFSRVWVRQEVAVARAVEIWCGDTEFTLKELVEASRFHVWSGLGETLLLLKSEKPWKSTSGRKIGCSAVGIENLQMWVNGIRHLEAQDFKLAADRLTGSESSDKHPLLRLFAVLLFLTFRDDATDNRDKVFVPLVLLKQIAESYGAPEVPLLVDYSMRQDDVYREATSWIIADSGSMGVLCLLQPDRLQPKVQHVQSWVPNYSCSSFAPLRLFVEDGSCRISPPQDMLKSHLRPSLEDSAFYVHAKYCGSVTDVGDTYESMIDGGCFELCARLLLNCPVTMSNGQNRLEVWWRTMCGESAETTSLSRADPHGDFKQWLVFCILRKIRMDFMEGRIRFSREHLAKMPSFELLAETDDSKMLPDWGFWQNFLSNGERIHRFLEHRPRFQTVELSGRRLFRTNDSVHIGVGPENIATGDEIWIIVGSALPVVLRRTDSSICSSSENTARVVIGESYINDVNHVLEKVHDKMWERLKLR